MRKLPFSFYERPTLQVAQDLLGKVLVRNIRGTRVGGIITETEAYIGRIDPAAHSFRGKTPRNEVMWEKGGHVYVYFIYGMYFCVNVVTESRGEPAAVLLRGVYPTIGVKMLKRLWPKVAPSKLMNGPGKLCNVLSIDKSLNKKTFRGPELCLYDTGLVIPKKHIKRTPRIGIREAKDKLWRFIVNHEVVERLSRRVDAKRRIET